MNIKIIFTLLLGFVLNIFAADTELILQNEAKINSINTTLESDIWIKKYNDYLAYRALLSEQEEAKDRLYVLKRQGAGLNEVKSAQKRLDTIKNQLSLLEQYKNSSLGDLTLVSDLSDRPEVTNPISIFYALTYIQKSVDHVKSYKERLASLDKTIDLLETKRKLLIERRNLDVNKSAVNAQVEQITQMLRDFENEREDFDATINIFEKKSQDVVKTLQGEIKAELTKLALIIFIVVIILAIVITSKHFAKKYWSDHHQERLYVASKILNFGAVTFIGITLLVAYSSNVSYMVTILGFASAGIAISLKDWFLSLFGWVAILATGQIRVGNRIKVLGRDGEILGDVLDISLLRVTLYEDVTLLSYDKDKRAGRIIFMPNSYIFTHMILNYNHSGMQTIWDSVYITLSFDSNVEHAITIAKDVATKHTKAFARLADKQINKMRANYSVPHYGTEPRVFTFVERGGIVLHVWFLAHYFSPMATKSAIGRDLVKELNGANDITIVYPMQSVIVQSPEASYFTNSQ